MLSEWRNKSWLRIKSLWRRSQLDRDLDDELQFHLAMREEKNRLGGADPGEARYAAHRQFGNATRLKEKSREMWTFTSLEDTFRDFRLGLRMLRKSAGFSLIAILTLALGIGANSALFSMVNGIVLRTLPYWQAQQLYAINENEPQLSGQSPWGPWFPVNPANFLLWQDHCPAISSMALIEAVTFNMTGHGIPRQVNAVRVSADFFSLMGIRPQLGRTFLPQEDQLGRDHEIILSDQFWREAFNSNPEILGRLVILDNT
ncbi:MAG: ABC transporter permease, partial [Candidatus Acidiferrum sp.]